MADRIPLWPAWKFGLKQGDLVTTIHDRFNTIPMAIQEPNPFAADVVEISTEVDAFQELEEKLGARRDERLKELCDAFETIALSIIGRPSLLPTTFSSQTWANAVRLFRHRSFDALLNYFMSNMTSLDENVQPIISPLDNHLSEEAVAAAKIKCAADVTSSFDRRPSRFGETPALSSDAAAPLSDLVQQPAATNDSSLATAVSCDEARTQERSGEALETCDDQRCATTGKFVIGKGNGDEKKLRHALAKRRNQTRPKHKSQSRGQAAEKRKTRHAARKESRWQTSTRRASATSPALRPARTSVQGSRTNSAIDSRVKKRVLSHGFTDQPIRSTRAR